MKRIAILVLAAFAFAAVIYGDVQSANVIRVVDGDTISLNGKSVRLIGYNAPDSGRTAACAAEKRVAPAATARLKQLVSAGGVSVRIVPCACRAGTVGTYLCNYGRACGVMTVRGANVANILIREGLAVRFTCGKTSCPTLPHPWCAP